MVVNLIKMLRAIPFGVFFGLLMLFTVVFFGVVIFTKVPMTLLEVIAASVILVFEISFLVCITVESYRYDRAIRAITLEEY